MGGGKGKEGQRQCSWRAEPTPCRPTAPLSWWGEREGLWRARLRFQMGVAITALCRVQDRELGPEAHACSRLPCSPGSAWHRLSRTRSTPDSRKGLNTPDPLEFWSPHFLPLPSWLAGRHRSSSVLGNHPPLVFLGNPPGWGSPELPTVVPQPQGSWLWQVSFWVSGKARGQLCAGQHWMGSPGGPTLAHGFRSVPQPWFRAVFWTLSRT